MIQLAASFLTGLSALCVGPFILSFVFGWSGKSWMAPLMGCIMLSIAGLIVFILNADILISAQLALIACGLFFLLHTFMARKKCEEYRYWTLIFSLVFLINLMVPFPGQLIAGGDWYVHLTKSTSLIDGTFGEGYAQLGRSPFYSWGSLAFIKLLGPLQGFTVYSDVVAASTLICILPSDFNAVSASQKKGLCVVLLLILISPFFITSLQNLWPKLAAAGAIAASARLARLNSSFSCSSAFAMLAVAIAYHESSIFYFPFIIGIMLDSGTLQISLIVTLSKKPVSLLSWVIKKMPEILVIAFSFVLFVGLVRFVQISRFGVDAIVSSNPLVTFARDISIPMRIYQNTLSTLFGDQFFYRLSDMSVSCYSSAVACVQMPYLFLAAVIPWLGGSLAGILLLWSPLAFREYQRYTLGGFRSICQKNSFTVGGSLFVVLLSLLVAQGGIHWGLIQVSLVQLALLYFYEAGRFAVRVGAMKKILLLNFFIGLLPFVIFSIAGGLIVINPRNLLGSLKNALISGDGDLRNMLSNNWNTFFVSSNGLVLIFTLPILALLLYAAYRYTYKDDAEINPPPSILFSHAPPSF